jgi:hypothetical protein
MFLHKSHTPLILLVAHIAVSQVIDCLLKGELHLIRLLALHLIILSGVWSLSRQILNVQVVLT